MSKLKHINFNNSKSSQDQDGFNMVHPKGTYFLFFEGGGPDNLQFCQNPTQLNSKQLELELDTVVRCSTTTPPTTTIFTATSRPVRELKFGTDTH